jgi:hypothetical protein
MISIGQKIKINGVTGLVGIHTNCEYIVEDIKLVELEEEEVNYIVFVQLVDGVMTGDSINVFLPHFEYWLLKPNNGIEILQ